MTVVGDRQGSLDLEAARLTVSWAGATDVGRRREVNEDSMALVPPLFAIADGMGGHAAGDRASAIAVARLAEAAELAGRSDGGAAGDSASTAPAAPETWLRRALGAAADDIDTLSEEVGSAGTTVTGVVLEDAHAHPRFLVFNLGDSRVYSMLGHELRRVTRDHSLVQELVEAGLLEEEDAEAHPDSNVITRALGFREEPAPDLRTIELTEGLRLLLCSDGLTKEVDSVHLRLLLGSGLSPSVTAAALVDAALAAGGHDNVTVLVIDVLARAD